MNIKNIILEATSTGATERDENGNVAFDLFGTGYSVNVTDAELEAHEQRLAAEAEQAEQAYVEAEAAKIAAKAKMDAYEARQALLASLPKRTKAAQVKRA